jgi:hypothetical protein
MPRDTATSAPHTGRGTRRDAKRKRCNSEYPNTIVHQAMTINARARKQPTATRYVVAKRNREYADLYR